MSKLTLIIRKKWFYLLVIALAFFTGLIVGEYKIPPYNSLVQIKHNIENASGLSFREMIYPTEKSMKKPTYKESESAIREMKKAVVDACNTPPSSTAYSFFVAGHIYGTPGPSNNTNEGIYDPFIKKFNSINQCKSMTYGFLLGDIVRESSSKSFGFVKRDLKFINSNIIKYQHDL